MKTFLVASLLISCEVMPFLIGQTFAVVDNFTHAVLDENFSAVWSSACRIDEASHQVTYNKYTSFEPQRVHSLHIVSFHIGDSFDHIDADKRMVYYSFFVLPSHVYDGRYQYSTSSINEDKINASGTRFIHRTEMNLSKSVNGATLSFNGNVKNLEDHSFNGFMLVFITENQLFENITWNYVFRDYGLNKTLNLAGLSADTFSGTWSIPNGVNANNIQVIAAVYDIDTKDPTNKWPYCIQSVCDVCGHSVAVPEFPNVWVCLLAVMSIFTAVMILIPQRKVSMRKISKHERKLVDATKIDCP